MIAPNISSGAVVSFEIEGGIEAGRAFVESLEVATLVEHVGSVETLITHPASMTHADVPPEENALVGVTPGLSRMSVGLEHRSDRERDLRHALDG